MIVQWQRLRDIDHVCKVNILGFCEQQRTGVRSGRRLSYSKEVSLDDTSGKQGVEFYCVQVSHLHNTFSSFQVMPELGGIIVRASNGACKIVIVHHDHMVFEVEGDIFLSEGWVLCKGGGRNLLEDKGEILSIKGHWLQQGGELGEFCKSAKAANKDRVGHCVPNLDFVHNVFSSQEDIDLLLDLGGVQPVHLLFLENGENIVPYQGELGLIEVFGDRRHAGELDEDEENHQSNNDNLDNVDEPLHGFTCSCG